MSRWSCPELRKYKRQDRSIPPGPDEAVGGLNDLNRRIAKGQPDRKMCLRKMQDSRKKPAASVMRLILYCFFCQELY